MKALKVLRPATAMLELVFALVIIGIVLMSAPAVISTANKSGFVALQQEAISAAATEIGMIMTYHWDEGDTDQNLSAPILLTNGNAGLNAIVDLAGNNLGIRAGSSLGTKRSFFSSVGTQINTTAINALGFDNGDVNISDDIDDFDNTNTVLNNIQAGAVISEGDYVDSRLTINTTVDYISDTLSTNDYRGVGGNAIAFNLNTQTNASPTTTNIKRIRVNLTTPNRQIDTNILLFAFSCNIGTYELEER